jgi:hypothetical protein
MDCPLLDGFVDQGDGLGKEFLSFLLVLLLDGFPEVFDLSAQARFIFSLEGVPAKAAAVLPHSREMLSHFFLLIMQSYDKIDAL